MVDGAGRAFLVREHQHEASPARADLDVEAAAVRRADLAGDRQPQAGAATGAGAALVQTHEAFEDPFAVGLGDARSVVLDLDRDVVAEDRAGVRST